MPFMADIIPGLDPLSQKLLQELQKTIDESHGWEYAIAKAKAREKLVSSHLVKYLVRPGNVLVDVQGLNTKSYMALNWPEEEPIDDDSNNEYYEAYDIPLRKKLVKRWSNLRGKYMRKRLEYKWKVPVCSCKFDGQFEIYEEVIDIEMKVAYEDEEVLIDQLSMFPLYFASEDLRSTLERRG